MHELRQLLFLAAMSSHLVVFRVIIKLHHPAKVGRDWKRQPFLDVIATGKLGWVMGASTAGAAGDTALVVNLAFRRRPHDAAAQTSSPSAFR